MAQWGKNLTNIYEDEGWTPGLSGLRIQRCHKLQCGSQMWFGSGIAVAVVQAPAVALIRL